MLKAVSVRVGSALFEGISAVVGDETQRRVIANEVHDLDGVFEPELCRAPIVGGKDSARCIMWTELCSAPLRAA